MRIDSVSLEAVGNQVPTVRADNVSEFFMRITGHALDVVYGRPAAGVRVRLDGATADGWQAIARAETDDHGHLHDWADDRLDHGAYRMVFDSDSYFANLGLSAVYPEIAVVLVMLDATESYWIRVLLAPFAYTVSFGSSR
ncbi:hydroxyisourate hydrolase [Micromonospora sp. DT201]|uniref:hydroxyisourate hydrolase n=1 Tax=Micromonospora sp. DT201 TaxID=3393442 RepID=UPI003CF24ABB